MKKSLLQIITLALAVVNLVLSVLLIITCMPAIMKTGKLVDRVCEIVDLNVSGANSESATVAIENLEEVVVTFSGDTETTINLRTDTDGRSHAILVSVSVVIDKSHADYKAKRATVDSAMSMMNGKIIETISKYTMNEAMNNKSEIKKEILGELRNLFDSDFIYDITFTQFIFQ